MSYTRTRDTFTDELQEHGTLLQTSYKDMEYFYGRATRTRDTFTDELQEHEILLETSYKMTKFPGDGAITKLSKT